MRTGLCALLAAVVLSGSAQPVATWVSETHDFGVFNETDGRQSCRMLLTNTGDSPLVIVRVQPTCGCTAGEFPTEPIAPGDTAAITLTYNPANRPGQFSKDVFVYTNATPSRSMVRITGNAIPAPSTLERQYPVAAGPLHLTRALIPLGEVQRTSFKLGYLSGYNASHDTVDVTVQSPSQALRVDCLPTRVPPAQTFTVTARLDGLDSPQWGLNEHHVTLRVADVVGVVTDTLDVTVTGVVVDDFKRAGEQWRAAPPRVDTGGVDRVNVGEMSNRAVSATLTLHNAGKQPLEVRRLWSADHALSLTVDKQVVKPGKRATVTVTVDPERVNDDVLNTSFTIMTNDPEQQLITVRVVGVKMK